MFLWKHICALLDGCDGAVRTKFIQLIARWKRAEMMQEARMVNNIEQSEPCPVAVELKVVKPQNDR